MNRTRGLLLAAALLFSTFGGAALAADAGADYKALLEAWKAGEYVRALGLAEALVTANPDFKYASAALYMGGSAGLRAKRYGRAEALYRELIRRFPDYKKTDGARNELVTALSRVRRPSTSPSVTPKRVPTSKRWKPRLSLPWPSGSTVCV